jgi:hypothetical protein
MLLSVEERNTVLSAATMGSAVIVLRVTYGAHRSAPVEMLKGHSFLSALPTKTPPSGETAGLAVTAPPVVTFHTSFPTDADRAYTNLFVLPRTTVPVASSIAGADNAAAVVKFHTCLPLLALRAKTVEADPM